MMYQHNTMFFPQSPLPPDGQVRSLSGHRKRKSSEPVEWSLTAPKIPMNASPTSSDTWRTSYLYVFGGDHAVRHNDVVERYRINSGMWEEVAIMPFPGVGIRAIRYKNDKNDIWVVGGPSCNDVYKFDTSTNQFSKQMKPMQCARQYLGLAELDGYLFAIGGEHDDEIHRTVEMCQPDQAWTWDFSLNTARSDFGVVTFDKKIFVAGGKTPSEDRTDSVEIYTIDGGWTQATRNMNIARSGFSLLVSVKSIFAVGGDRIVSISKRREDGQWVLVSDDIHPQRRRHRGSAVNRCGKFYFVGGERDGESTNYADAFAKSQRQDDWIPLLNMHTARSRAAVLLVILKEPLKDDDGNEGQEHNQYPTLTETTHWNQYPTLTETTHYWLDY